MGEQNSASLWNWCCNSRFSATVMRPASGGDDQVWSADGNFLVPKGVSEPNGLGSPSSYLQPAPTVVENHTTEELVGVGIVFESTRSGQTGLVVASLASGGSAMRAEGKIEPGDELVGVDGRNVREMDPFQIAPLILGKQGSLVEMEFREKDSQQHKIVTLARSYIMRR